MIFPLNVYGIACLGALVASALTLPLWRAACRRAGLVDDPGPRKIHAAPVPLAGGFAVLTGVTLPLAVGAWLLHVEMIPLVDFHAAGLLEHGFERRGPQLAAVLAGAVAMLILGWLDDRHELSVRVKFAGQVLVAAAVAAAGVRITVFVPSLLFSYAVTILWIVTLTNAFNFIDNMNGLCAGLGALAAWSFAWFASIHGQYLVATVAWLAFGALLGFLPFNFPRATVFLGDAGSHLVGYFLAVLAILPHFYSPGHPMVLAVFSPLLILGVPLADLVAVVVLRWRRGRPVYVGDTNHFSHRLVRRGLSKPAAVLVLWLAAALIDALLFWIS